MFAFLLLIVMEVEVSFLIYLAPLGGHFSSNRNEGSLN